MTFSSIAAAENPQNDELKKLQGEWREVEEERELFGSFSGLRFMIVGDQMAVGSRKMTIKLDATKSPKEIDIMSQDARKGGKLTARIYKLESDRLTTCLPNGTTDTTTRPKDFQTRTNDELRLLVLRHV